MKQLLTSTLVAVALTGALVTSAIAETNFTSLKGIPVEAMSATEMAEVEGKWDFKTIGRGIYEVYDWVVSPFRTGFGLGSNLATGKKTLAATETGLAIVTTGAGYVSKAAGPVAVIGDLFYTAYTKTAYAVMDHVHDQTQQRSKAAWTASQHHDPLGGWGGIDTSPRRTR